MRKIVHAIKRNARFWVFLNGSPVKMTMTPGQVLSWGRFEYTDEGYDSEEIIFSFDRGWVHKNRTTRSRDCDGPLDTYTRSMCPLYSLKDIWCEDDGLPYPDWTKVSSHQRDYFAEAMGY